MKYAIITALLLCSQHSFAQCELNKSSLRAEYQLNVYKNAQLSQQSNIILWRQGDTVAHQYPQTNITESWYLLKNQRIKATRFFDHYQRAIEYQAGEQVQGKSEQDWSYRYQLLSDSLLATLTLQSESGEGCQRQQVFSKQTDQGRIEVIWLAEVQLLTSFSWTKGEVREQWHLTRQTYDVSTVNDFFANLANYQSTDYADIGDDHHDPFLSKMLTLGFVEQGASGYYDADGKSLD